MQPMEMISSTLAKNIFCSIVEKNPSGDSLLVLYYNSEEIYS